MDAGPQSGTPNIGIPAGEKIVNSFRRATAVYYKESKRIMVAGEDFMDCRKAIAGLERRVWQHEREEAKNN